MLCDNCKSIDLKDFFTRGAVRWDDSRLRMFHDVFSDMIAKSHYCNLCKFITRAYDARDSSHEIDLKTRIHRSIEASGDLKNGFRSIRDLKFGDEFHDCFIDNRLGPALAELEPYVEKDSPLIKNHTITGRPIRPAEDLRQIQEWYSSCLGSHAKCKPSHSQVPAQTMPSRLVDVGTIDSSQVRLVSSDQCTSAYVTLSYCWGMLIETRLTTVTLDEFKSGIEVGKLCKTISDAITVARGLQFRYLWVDSLCIIQDDPNDWKREALNMSMIYSQSALTIAATASEDAEGGLFHSRWEGTLELAYTADDGQSCERVRFRPYHPSNMIRLVAEAPLNQRGWTMQERTLSRRIVHFTAEKLFWECEVVTLEEGVDDNLVANLRGYFDRWNFDYRQIPESLVISEDPYALDSDWHNVVKEYSRRQLTCENDRLPALAGIARTYAEANGDRYIVGLWQKHLPLNLLWAKTRDVIGVRVSRYPSWTWASLYGAVRFLPVSWIRMEQYKDMIELVDDIVIKIDGNLTDQQYGNVDSVSFTLSGRVKSTMFQGERTTNERDQDMPWQMNHDTDRLYLHKLASFDYEPKLQSKVPMLQLCAFDTEYERTEFVLLLKQVSSDNCFERIGLGVITWEVESFDRTDSWFNDVSPISLSLV